MKLSMNRIIFKVAIAKKDLTQSKVAETLGVTPNYLSLIVNGKGINKSEAIKIAKFLGVQVEELFFKN